MHPAVLVFIARGGAGSFYEGLYVDKRLAVFPFFGDQFLNAYNVEHKDIGVYLSYELNQEQMNEKITLDCSDSDENCQKNANRYKALIQVHSRDDCIRAADLVEEVSFVNKQGQLPYRYEASFQMSFIKANNVDLYVVSVGIVLTLTLVSMLLCRHILKSRRTKAKKKK